MEGKIDKKRKSSKKNIEETTKEVKSNTTREIAINMIKMNNEDISKVIGLSINEMIH